MCGYPLSSSWPCIKPLMAIGSLVSMPVAGVEYPRNWPEFRAFFPDEEACLRYLERVRWPDGFRCPGCAHGEAWRTQRGLLRVHCV